ncbi:hypothetical protein D3C75_549420 [compost metagenome]
MTDMASRASLGPIPHLANSSWSSRRLRQTDSRPESNADFTSPYNIPGSLGLKSRSSFRAAIIRSAW